MAIHRNSLAVFREKTSDGTIHSRLLDVLETVKNSPRPLRDWDILQKLFPGRDDMNLVRPRITELYESGHLVEGPPMTSHQGNRNVRTSVPKETELQQSFF